MPEVMDAAAGDNIVAPGKMEALYQVFEQAAVHFFIIHKTRRFTFPPVFQSFLNLLYKAGR